MTTTIKVAFEDDTFRGFFARPSPGLVTVGNWSNFLYPHVIEFLSNLEKDSWRLITSDIREISEQISGYAVLYPIKVTTGIEFDKDSEAMLFKLKFGGE